MEWWLWVVLGVVLITGEMVVPGGLFLLFFGVGAMLVALLVGVGIGGSQPFQWCLFMALSIVCLALFRSKLKAIWSPAGNGKEIDSIVGEIGLAMEAIGVDAIGKVELRGTGWSAKNIGGSALNQGERCKVDRVEGLTLYVRAWK